MKKNFRKRRAPADDNPDSENLGDQEDDEEERRYVPFPSSLYCIYFRHWNRRAEQEPCIVIGFNYLLKTY